MAATAVALLMLIGAGALSWMVVTSGVLSASPATAETVTAAPEAGAVEVETAVAQPSAVISGGFQVSQPRDPFRPLITEESPIAGQPGTGGTGGTGSGGGFNPAGNTITLQEIRDITGVMRATVIVNGISYDVGVGETFAGSYKVISLSEDKGVFTFGDNAFELTVGQQILK
ncbi:MAG: hypothetical protein GY720_10255 [bacterium]|nr:hypothetical protein [bacterium]